jgi:Protein of unknown function (DUF1064).
MSISKNDFRKLVAANPNMKVVVGGRSRPISAHEMLKELNEPAKNKYRNQKIYVHEDGFIASTKTVSSHGKVIDHFDSLREHQRWHELQLLQKAEKITNLAKQSKLVIQDAFVYHGKKISGIAYIADFIYTKSNGEIVVEDVKGFDSFTGKHLTTNDFNLKWKLLKAKYPNYYFELY